MKKNKLKIDWIGQVVSWEETKVVRVFMKRNIEGKRGRRKMRWLDGLWMILKMAVGARRMWKIKASGGLGPSWPTPNSQEEDKEEEK